MININTTGSIRGAINSIETIIKADIEEVAEKAESEIDNIVDEFKKDATRLVHSLHVTALNVGQDITIKFDHANGEVKRIVLNGELTLEKLITHLRTLHG